MLAAETLDYDVFDCGPPMRLEQRLGLRSHGRPSLALRIAVLVAVSWIPLLLFTIVQSYLGLGPGVISFVSDCGVNVRTFIVIPALIFAEIDCLPWLRHIVGQFVATGLVVGADVRRFEQTLTSTRRLLDSPIADASVLICAYAVTIALLALVPRSILPTWYIGAESAPLGISLAGWWHSLVTLPILLALFFGWFWRLALWSWFLWRMARLDLQLVPAHPDQAGGLRFVSLCLQRFRSIAFALGTIVAGSVANRVIYQGARIRDYEMQIVALVVVVLVLFAAPLVVFAERLRDAKRRGICDYGALALSIGEQFERKWLRSRTIPEKPLTAPDFSATTDLYAVVANVYAMRDVPFGLIDLIGPVVGALVPFVPIVLLVLPLQTLLADLADLFL